MIGMHMRPQDYVVGQRVVAGRGRRLALKDTVSYEEMRVETVESIDQEAIARGSNAAMTLRHQDQVRTVMLCHTGISDTAVERQPWQTLWTEPLPDDDAAAIKLVAGALGFERPHSAALIWIGSPTETGRAYAHFLMEHHDADRFEHQPIPSTGMAYLPLASRIQTEEQLAPRTLVVAGLRKAYVEDGVVTHVIDCVRTVLLDVGLEDAAKAVPVLGRQRNHFGSANFAGLTEICENEERAHAMAEPSEALVFCWMDGDSQQVKVLAKTGIHFWRNDDPECYAEQTVPGPGLWLWADVEGHAYTDHEGGHDYDMDGSMLPAVEQDVERMFGSMDDLVTELHEYTGTTEADIVARHMALAVEADERDRRQAEERKVEMERAEAARRAPKAA